MKMTDVNVNMLNSDASRVNKKKSRFRPRLISRWPDEDVMELIACIEDNPPLWNKKYPKHMYREIRGTIWKEISLKVFCGKYDRFQLLAKWGILRTIYRSYMRAVMSGRPVYWKFYAPMKFLGSTVRDADEQNDFAMLNDGKKRNASNKSIEHRSLTRRIPTNSESSVADNGVSHENPTVELRQRNYETSSYETTTTQQSVVVESLKAAVDCNKSTAGNDEFDIFGKYVASQLRAIDVETARRIKNKLSRFLLNALDAIEDEPVVRYARS